MSPGTAINLILLKWNFELSPPEPPRASFQSCHHWASLTPSPVSSTIPSLTHHYSQASKHNVSYIASVQLCFWECHVIFLQLHSAKWAKHFLKVQLKHLPLWEFSLIPQIWAAFPLSWLHWHSGYISHWTTLKVYMSDYLTTVWAPQGPSLCICSSLYPWHKCLLKEKISDWIYTWMKIFTEPPSFRAIGKFQGHIVRSVGIVPRLKKYIHSSAWWQHRSVNVCIWNDTFFDLLFNICI